MSLFLAFACLNILTKPRHLWKRRRRPFPRRRQTIERLANLTINLHRRLDRDIDIHMTRRTVRPRDTLASHAETGPALSRRWNRDGRDTLEGRHIEPRAARRGDRIHRHTADDI